MCEVQPTIRCDIEFFWREVDLSVHMVMLLLAVLEIIYVALWCRYAIAHAVLKHLSTQQDCRQLFATHYHPLTAEFADSPKVALGHMAAVVTNPSSGSTFCFLSIPCNPRSSEARGFSLKANQQTEAEFDT